MARSDEDGKEKSEIQASSLINFILDAKRG